MDDSRPALHSTSNSSSARLITSQRELSHPVPVAECWCHTTVRITKMRYIWTISNFSFCREDTGEILKSSTFSSGAQDKLKWCLRINPKGLDDDSKEYLSLYLLLTNSGANKEARAKFRFSILNGRREETKAMESQRAYRFVQGKDWGFKKFIRRDVLMDETNGLLPNDQLTVLCEVSVVGETFSESGQLNARPMSVLPCNLHNDMEELLKNELFADVVLIIIEPETSSSTCLDNARNSKQSNEAIPASIHSDTSESKHDYLYDYSVDKYLIDRGFNSFSDLQNSDSRNAREEETSTEDEINEENFEYGDDDVNYDEDTSYNTARNNSFSDQDQNISEFRSSGDSNPNPTFDRGSDRDLPDDSNDTKAFVTQFASSSSSATTSRNCLNSNEASAVVPTNRNRSTAENPTSPPCSSSPGSNLGARSMFNAAEKFRVDSQQNIKPMPHLAAFSSITSSEEGTSQQVKPDDGQPRDSQDQVDAQNFNESQATSSTDTSNRHFENVSRSNEVKASRQPTSTTSNDRGNECDHSNNENGSASASSDPKLRPSQLDQVQRAETTAIEPETSAQIESCQQMQPGTSTNSNAAPKVVREFRAHKAILAARSPVFAAMFEHSMEESREGRVEINDLKAECMAEVLRYIYTGRCANIDQLAPELLAAEDKYQLDQLKMMCELRLVQGLCVENACDTLVLADRHNAPQLKIHTLDYIMIYAEDICQTEGFDELSKLQPHLLNELFRALAVQHLPLRHCSRKRPRPTS